MRQRDTARSGALATRGRGEPARPAGDAPTEAEYPRRRLLMAGLVGATIAALIAAMGRIVSYNGITWIEVAMMALYALTLPWLAIGFWNAVLGLLLSRRHGQGAAAAVTPAIARADGADPIRSRVAVIMAIRNEAADRALARIAAIEASLARTAWADAFEYHVLSDTDDPETAEREEALVRDWRGRSPGADIRYRRRQRNTGFKAGNIAEFVRRRHGEVDFFLPLDADSAMSGRAVLRLVRIMQASPEIGMLQGLVVGTPAAALFTRAFQFGMRHGMRSFTLGSAWWQGDCGPNWGHNVLIRMAPFHDHCLLPELPGRPPMGGHILSHDQVEAALMRRAGFEVRVLAEEDESFEDNPPSLPDFIRRELRWCHGNMQYFGLVGWPGLKPLSRVQLALAILMYLSAPAWIAFILLGAALAGTGTQLSGVPVGEGIAIFAAIMTLSLMPKLMGIAQVLTSRRERKRYGGAGRVVAGGIGETVFSVLIAPSVAVALTLCLGGLMLGRRLNWGGQRRDGHRLGWGEAVRMLWPQTLLGVALLAWLWATAPWTLAFAAPVIVALALSVPIAVVTTLPGLGRLTRRAGLFDIPEDRRRRPAALPRADGWPSHQGGLGGGPGGLATRPVYRAEAN